MIQVCLMVIDAAKQVNKELWEYNIGDSCLAARNIYIGPLPKQLHGLLARVHLLPSHYTQNFEEMVQYGLVEDWQLPCFSITTLPDARFIY